ncbi:MAG TPA: hypothetical protein VIJ60_08780 [Acidimicrobiales bacterium]
MIVIDEYLAVRLAGGAWPPELPDDEPVLPTSRHWRLLQALHGSRRGKLSQLLDGFSPSARDGVRYPHAEVFGILDPRPLLDEAAMIAARYGETGWLIAETLAAGLAFGNRLCFGSQANVGRVVSRAADELGIAVQVIGPH